MTIENDYDIIVIGSGWGGMSTASLMAQLAGKRVLVLERHFKLGGFTHCFRRKKYEWDTGVHYVGEMQDGAQTRKIMDLITGGQVKWNSIGKVTERFMFPGESFDWPDNPEDIKAALTERFPAEEKNIKLYFRDLDRIRGWLPRWYAGKTLPRIVATLLTLFRKRLATINTEEYLEKRFDDPLLRGILAGQWPDFGTPPSESAFAFHATVAADFLNGGYFPVGGGDVMSQAATKIIEEHGGRCLVNHSVEEVLIENNRAVGVKAIHKGKEVVFHAPVIISNAGGVITFGKLVGAQYGKIEKERVARMEPGPSALLLSLGLKDDPRKHGFDGRNYWMFRNVNHRPAAEASPHEKVEGAYFGIGSLRNPGQSPHCAQIISFSDIDSWAQWEDTQWKKRGDDYEQRKEEIAEKLVDFGEEFLPGVRDLIEFKELSTPLSVKSFTDHWRGVIYGCKNNHNRLFRDSWSVSTSVKNLYMTGSDVGTSGINGTMMAGVMTAGQLLGPIGVPQIMMKADSHYKQLAKDRKTAPIESVRQAKDEQPQPKEAIS